MIANLNMSDYAVKYAARGWHIFPVWWVNPDSSCGCGNPTCKVIGKHPIGQCAPRGVWDATNDPSRLLAWWRAYPNANIAMHCGASGVVAIDLDEYKDMFDAAATGAIIAPADEQTITNLTGGGGTHLLYKSPDGERFGSKKTGLPSGIDVKCWGGYVILPPSNHKSGNCYHWELNYAPGEIDLLPLPPKLHDILRAAQFTAAATPTAITPNMPKPDIEPWKLPGWLIDKLNNKEPVQDRSENNWEVCCALGERGLSDDNLIAIWQHYPIGTQGKYADHKTPEKYLSDMIGNMRAKIGYPMGQYNGFQSGVKVDLGGTDDLAATSAAARPNDDWPVGGKPAIWRNGSHDEPVMITGVMGEIDGKIYYRINGSTTGIPADEISWVEETSAPGGAGKGKPPNLETRYQVDGGRICAKTKVGGGDESIYLPLCNFHARIVADVEQDDGECTERYVAIAGGLDNGQSLPEVIVKSSEFESLGWAMGKWGGRVSIEPGRGTKDRLRHAIQTLSMGKMEYRRVYTHTGWRMLDGNRVYLHAGGAIGADGVQVELPANLANYQLPHDQRVAEKDAMRASIDLLDIAPARVSAPLWAAMFLAPLSEIITPAFVLWVEGQSGSLKSSYTAVMLNHFGERFHEYALPADWLGTANSLEKLSFHAKDAPFIIDDFRPATSRAENKQMQDAAARIIRAAGNRQGRSRLDSDSQFKRTYAPRGVVISTAERGALGLSVNSRLLTVEVEPGDVDKQKLSIAQQQRQVYGYAMAGFIRYVAEHWEEVTSRSQDNVSEKRISYSVTDQHARLPNAIATLFAAFNMAMHYAQVIGAITKDEAERRLNDCSNALVEMAESQNAVVEAQDPALRFIITIITLLAQGRAVIDGKNGASSSLSERSYHYIQYKLTNIYTVYGSWFSGRFSYANEILEIASHIPEN